jgi:hypothetical protein
MALFFLIILYIYMLAPDEYLLAIRKFIVCYGATLIKWGKTMINEGPQLARGFELESNIRNEYLFDLPRDKNASLPLYKHFTAHYEKVSETAKRSGDFDESKMKVFCDILSSDLSGERQQRQFLANNIIQMILIGFVILLVLYMTIYFFRNGDNHSHMWSQLFIQIVGALLFYIGITKYRNRVMMPFMHVSQTLQSLIIFSTSGLSVQEILALSQFRTLLEKNYTDKELSRFKGVIIKTVNYWRESGEDCERELRSIHLKMENHLSLLNEKVMRAASSWRLIILSIFYLSSYLINIMILLETYLGESFYSLDLN